jgi:imidazolonepropionase-like amidohydrolase
MHGEDGLKMTRRDMLQLAAASAVLLSLPAMTGCASVPKLKTASADQGQTLALIHGHVIDVIQGVVLHDRTITVRDGVIESVSDRIPEPGAECLVVDMKNQYLIPGLIDAHCHSTLSSEAEFNPFGVSTMMKQIRRNYVQQLAQGVTTIRDMGSLPKLLHKNLALIEKGELTGPRVVYCNAFTNVYGSHPDLDPSDISMFAGITMAFTGNPSFWFKDIPELEKKMRQSLENGASFIKLTMDNRSLLCGKGAIPVYSDEQLKIIFDFARKNDLPVSGHIHTKFGFDRALQYGMDSMEHAIADAWLTDREVLEMAQKNIAIVPTLIIAQMLAAEEAFDRIPDAWRNDFVDHELEVRRQMLNASPDRYVEPAIHQKNVEALQYYRKYGCDDLYNKGKFLARPDLYFNVLLHGPENLRKMKEAGIVIGCGTDAGVPYVYHGMLWREMEILERTGFSKQEVLRCATLNNAKILRMQDRIGTIDAGKYADMVVLADNPFERIETLRDPQQVIKGGRIFDVAESRAVKGSPPSVA